MIELLGALPPVQFHPALTGCLQILSPYLSERESAQLKADLDVNLEFNLDPIKAKFEAAIAAAASLSVGLPGLKVGLDARLKADLQALLALTARIKLLLGKLEAALAIGSIHAFGYTGGASSHGTALQAATANGFGSGLLRVQPSTPIDALILEATDRAQWLQLQSLLFVGGTEVFSADNFSTPSKPKSKLTYHGRVPGPTLFAGAGLAAPGLVALLAELALKVADLEASIAALFALNIELEPLTLSASIGVAIEGLLELGIPFPELILDVEVSFDIVLALAPIVAQLRAALSGPGVAAWRYRGLAGELGSAFAGVSIGRQAQPGSHGYGLTLATTSVEDWGSLAGVLYVGR